MTIPAGCKIHTPGGYVFNDPYYQDKYELYVQWGEEDEFWEDYDELVEGRDYVYYSTESTEDLTSENASQVFGSATVIFASYNVTANMVNDAYWSTFYSNECNYQASEGTQVFAVNLTGDAIEMNEITDGIESATLNDNVEMINDNVYDLQGRRVSQPAKGLYIVNGKKYIKK